MIERVELTSMGTPTGLQRPMAALIESRKLALNALTLSSRSPCRRPQEPKGPICAPTSPGPSDVMMCVAAEALGHRELVSKRLTAISGWRRTIAENCT